MNSVVLIGKLAGLNNDHSGEATIKLNVDDTIVPVTIWDSKELLEKLENSLGNLAAIKGKIKMFNGDITIVAEKVSVITKEEN